MAVELVAFLVLATTPAPTDTVAIPQVPAVVEPAHQPPANPAATITEQLDQVPRIASVASRSLFEPAGSRTAPTRADSAPKAPSTHAKDLAARLSLIGIIAGDPAQAIIEDTQTKKTYFVTAGQPVIEGLVIEEVRGDRVVLALNGEKIELSL